MLLCCTGDASDLEALRAAVQSGCGAVYLGWGNFNARRSANPDYPMTVYYAFKQTETTTEGRTSTGWSTILEGMIRSGWTITATWPMRSERRGRMTSIGANALASSIVLVLRPRPEDAPMTDRRSLMRELRRTLPEAVETLRSGGILNLNALAIALGEFAAPMGTGAALVILACGLVLWTQKDVHIGASASFLITCGLIAFFFPRQVGLADSPLFSSLLPRLQGIRDELHTGAVLFCAVFLLNEPYTCAHHRLGRILYGALVGAATMGFRYFGVYETGVCFALLAVNSVSALIDRTEERLYRLLHRLPSERKEAAE